MTRAQFDREQVLEDATRLFWQQGFSGASMQQVVQATGLKPGSLYLAFGSKEGLFNATLQHYATRSVGRVREVLESAPSVGKGICQVLLRMVDEAANKDYCSCFLIKSQLELAAQGGELAKSVTAYMAEMEALYIDFLSREYPLPQARQYAASVIIHIYGVRVYGYRGDCRDTLLAALKSGLPWLPWDG